MQKIPSQLTPILAAAILLCALTASAQTSSGTPPVSSETIQQTQQNQAKKGKVILQRSIDENGQTVEGPQSPAATPANKIDPSMEKRIQAQLRAKKACWQ